MKKDTYATPQSVFDYFDREFTFDFDVCAEDSTAKCFNYFTKEDDALAQDWNMEYFTAWCNPPYSNIMPWVDKAIRDQDKGVTTVMLVMCDPSVGWFKRALEKCSEVRFIIGGRLSFEMDAEPQKGNNKGSVVFVFRPHNHNAHTSYIDRKELL